MDGIKVTERRSHLESHRDIIATSILNHTFTETYQGSGNSKEQQKVQNTGDSLRIDRWLQLSVNQVLMTKYELTFE
ncbi:hypothetical protein [Pleomorphovibrio marinus]|uniref:hypothetical protein n=1 Tax=Pleomorphovibrio marinus TaxID=2164132 RepID=UPI0013004970|nr:hypothetical protein [Pleomorphovibrio marinus]